jgi:hypothetical protein
MLDEIKIEAIYSLLPAQRGLLVDSLAGEGDQYRQQICVEVEVPTSVSILERHIRSVVERNTLLRTVFDWSDDEPMQVVVNGIPPVVGVFPDTSNIEIILENEKKTLQPVSDAPPVRFAIIESHSKIFLVVTYHHILLDGPSVEMLLDQIISGTLVSEVPVTIYQEWLEDNISESEFAIWRSTLNGLEKYDGKLEGTIIDKPSRHQAKLGDVFHRKLIAKAKKLQITPATYMQTIWSEWALSYFNRESLLYGLVMSTRMPDLTDNAMGPYISTLPWLVHKNGKHLDDLACEMNDALMDMGYAKHIPLGEITKYISPYAMGFDAIVTIATHPVKNNALYNIMRTYENTGYGLSVDIEISEGVTVSFTSVINEMDNALRSFIEYCNQQIDSVGALDSQQHYAVSLTATEGLNHTATSREKNVLKESLIEIFDIAENNVDMNSSFLEMGGDSIIALRLKSLLKTAELDVSIGDILQSSSILELSNKLLPAHSPKSSSTKVAADLLATARMLFGDKVESVTSIPESAAAIVQAYRLGYGQDYHEQTAFRLKGIFDKDVLSDALEKLALEHPTMRIAYPPELQAEQVLQSDLRISIEFKAPNGRSFDKFVDTVSDEYLNKPFHLHQGSLLRMVACQGNADEWYLFMSFSALVTDGWSFSTMLERLFDIYDELLRSAYVPQLNDQYMKHSIHTRQEPILLVNEPANDNYSSEVTGENFLIDQAVTSKIFEKSENSHRTISEILMQFVRQTLHDEDFVELKVYENGRDEPETFSSVGPYSMLSSKPINKSGHKKAYYVFENYPRESENRLRNGAVKYFEEFGNWRRDLLPPSTSMGYLFDVVEDTIQVRVIVRQEHAAETYWHKLIATINKEL